jgi:hypothetical protein
LSGDLATCSQQFAPDPSWLGQTTVESGDLEPLPEAVVGFVVPAVHAFGCRGSARGGCPRKSLMQRRMDESIMWEGTLTSDKSTSANSQNRAALKGNSQQGILNYQII